MGPVLVCPVHLQDGRDEKRLTPRPCDHALAAGSIELSPQAIAILMRDFGTFIQFLRQRSHVFQTDVRATLAQILAGLASKDTYSWVELGTRAPQFRQLAAIYKAMVRSGIEIRPEEREAYVLLARQRIESKGTCNAHVGASQWEALAAELAAFDAGE